MLCIVREYFGEILVLCCAFQALDEMILLQDRDAVLGSEEEFHEQGPDIVVACCSNCPYLSLARFYTFPLS